MSDRTDRQPVWPLAVAGLVIAFIGWNVFSGRQAMNRMAAENTALGNAGTAPGNEWLAQLRSDPAVAHTAASADFRRRVPADRLAAFAKSLPAQAELRLKSYGGGRVGSGLFGPPSYVGPRLVLAGPDGLTLEFVLEDDQPRLNAVRVNDADPFAGP